MADFGPLFGMTEKPLIFYDGKCGLCSRWVQFVIRRDPAGEFRFAPLQDERAAQFLNQYNLSSRYLSTMVFSVDGKCFIKSDAALQVVRRLSGIWKLASVFLIVPKILRDTVYDFIAGNRYRFFGQTSSCLLPSPERHERFL